MTTFSFGAVASFFVCLLAIITLRPLAVAIDLVDKPGGRKTHHGNVPIVGGIAMFLGLAVGLGLNPIDSLHAETLIAASGLLVVTGLLDDRFELSPWLRLPAQAAATLLVISAFYPNPTLSFGNPLGTGEIVFHGLAACLVILFFVVGAINAMNMLDGMDGLAGAVSLVALASIAALTWNSGLTFTSHVSLTLGGAVVAFLFFNLPTRRNRELRCFMGDAGSMMIGFLLALLCMRMSQGDTPVMAPVGVLWLVALPIYELLWTILRRLRMINRVDEVRATGGVFRSQLWRDVVAGVFNRPLIVTGAAEGSGLGAAILGAVALGVVDNLQDGYSLLRGDSEETRIVVSEQAKSVYETMHYQVPQILQRYGRLGADLR